MLIKGKSYTKNQNIMSTKNFKFILLGILLCLPYYFVGQTITVNKQFSHDTVVSIDNYFKGKCSKAEFNGTIVLHSDTSVVRIMMTDTQGKKWLVAEAYPLIATDTIVTMLRSCEETKYLAYNTNPVNLEIYMTNASCSITTIIFANAINLNYVAMAKTQKLNVENQKVIKMNANLEEKEMLWRAALSDEVLIKYSTRAAIEDSYKGNINGYWYYNGGYYCDYSTY
jgi:hypothetical protein